MIIVKYNDRTVVKSTHAYTHIHIACGSGNKEYVECMKSATKREIVTEQAKRIVRIQIWHRRKGEGNWYRNLSCECIRFYVYVNISGWMDVCLYLRMGSISKYYCLLASKSVCECMRVCVCAKTAQNPNEKRHELDNTLSACECLTLM